MTWRTPVTKNHHATLISTYIPTVNADLESKETVYATLNSGPDTTSPTDKLILLEDFNARVGSDSGLWKGTLGQHGIGKVNDNGLCLLTLLHSLLTLTLSALKISWSSPTPKFKTPWQHPRSKHWHLLDYIIVCRTDRKEVLISRAVHGADCWTDHWMI